jgi:hypothetical protein
MSDKEYKNNDHEAVTVPCCLKVTEHKIRGAVEVPTLLARVFTDGKIAGIIWATDGTRSIDGLNPASPGQGATLKVSSPDGFDISQVYEARIWRVTTDIEEDATLAHEFRWVNGVNAVELTLTANTAKASSKEPESGKPYVSGWANKVSYLQHKSAATSKEESAPDTSTRQTQQEKQDTATNEMSAVEFIQEEDKYGNTVVVDQLFTGEWKYNA